VVAPNLNKCAEGSAEDELSDGEPKYTKIRPMRVEMFLHCSGQRGDYQIGNDPRRPKN